MADAQAITRALGGRWRGRYGTARCPAHNDRTPSLKLADGADGRLLLKCYAGCSFTDVLAELRCRGLVEQRRSGDDLPRVPRPKAAPKRAETVDQNTRFALQVWTEARDPGSTVVEAYLHSRGLVLEADVACCVLRFHPGLKHPYDGRVWPAMVGLFRDLRTDQPTGIYRTFLARDGSAKAPIEKPRLMLGRASRSAIKLDADDRVELGLVVSEGIETALSSRQLGYRPCWALGSASAISGLPVLGGIEALTIHGENDENGTNAEAAQACVQRWTAAGVDVEVLEPVGGKDANDVLLRRAAR